MPKLRFSRNLRPSEIFQISIQRRSFDFEVNFKVLGYFVGDGRNLPESFDLNGRYIRSRKWRTKLGESEKSNKWKIKENRGIRRVVTENVVNRE